MHGAPGDAKTSWLRSLPKKRTAVSGLFRDPLGRILLLSRVYGPGWVLPGGIVEAGESPASAFRREVAEELGLDRAPGRILCLDWVPGEQGQDLDGLVVVFEGGTLTREDIASIRLPADEIGACHFVAPDGLPDLHRGARVRACVRAWRENTALYLQNGSDRPAS